ncbi:MAG: MFS transporter [Actinobacteria bacterium 13_2_20CM_2_71_6]|nr:MAG: MFS transporter [Actinobacteria bacterium 13_2_20CM_2_71_6]
MTDTIIGRPRVAIPSRVGGALLATILFGQFMAILDVSIVNVAVPTIRSDLHAGGAALQLVVAGYTIAYAVLLITGARLGDRLGHRRVFLFGLVTFTVASLACGLAGSTGALIGFRLVQGAGAALMVPQVLSLIQRHFIGGARARAFGLYAAVIAGAAVVGQVAGGALVSANLGGTGWRPVFLVNVPIGVLLVIAAHRLLPADRGEPGRGFDLAGVFTLAAAVLLFVVPLVLGHEEHWPVWGWVSLGASAVLFGVFALVERRAASPLVPGRLLTAPGMLPALGAIFGLMAAYAGFLLTQTLHLQGGLGFSPWRAGLTFLPGAASFAFASLNWRRIPARWHGRMVPLAILVGGTGLGLLGLAVREGGPLGPLFWVAMPCFGLGFGAAFSPLLTLALRHVPPADAADASGMIATMTQLAQVVGVATFGTLYLSLVPGTPSGRALALTCAGLVAVNILAAVCAALLPRRDASPAPVQSEKS